MNDEFNKNPLSPEEEVIPPSPVQEPEAIPCEEPVTEETPAEEPSVEEVTVEEVTAEETAAQEIPAEPVVQQAAEPEPDEIPTVQAEPVSYSQPKTEKPIYSQQPYGGSYYSAPTQNYVQPVAQPPKKDKKGLKIFGALIILVLVFAIGFGLASIKKSNSGSESSDAPQNNAVQNEDAPNLNINESPVSPTAAQVEGALTTAQIAAKVKPSIVGVVVYTKNSNSSAGEGTGVIMGEDKSGNYTYIITCAHVINDPGINVRIQTENGTTYDADIIGVDTRTDLGVLKIKAKGLPAAEFGNSDSLRVGDSVYAIGNPGGIEFFGSFTGGFVSAIDRPVSSEIGYTMKCIQHDAAINPGNSGGALVNVYGQVIGINSQKIAATDYEGMGFAIPITSAKKIVEDLIKYNYVPNRPKLGITYYPVSASAQYSMIAQIKGLPAGTLIINEISGDSSLADTEIRQYDMITAVNGKPLTTADVLLEKIDSGKVGDKLVLSICRVNSDYTTYEFDVEITLVEDKGESSKPAQTTIPYIDPFEYFNQFGY